MKLLGILATCLLIVAPFFASEETVEIGGVQMAKSLGGTVTDPADAPMSGVQVIEVSEDWHTTVRSTVTDARGHWSLAPVPNEKVYYIRIVKGGGFDELRFRVRLD